MFSVPPRIGVYRYSLLYNGNISPIWTSGEWIFSWYGSTSDTRFARIKHPVINVNYPRPYKPVPLAHYPDILIILSPIKAYFEPLSLYPNKITPKPKQAENEP